MNYLSCVDKITNDTYGFRVLPSDKKEETITASNELIGIVRVINNHVAEKRVDPLALQADDVIYTARFEGEITFVKQNLRELDDNKIAVLFSQCLATFQKCHKHKPTKVIVRHLQPMGNPLHQEPLLLFYGNCGAVSPPNHTTTQIIDFFENRFKEFETKRSVNQDRFALFVRKFSSFSQSEENIDVQERTRIQSLADRIDKVKRDLNMTMPAANCKQSSAIVAAQKPSGLNDELRKTLMKRDSQKTNQIQEVNRAPQEDPKPTAELSQRLVAVEAQLSALEALAIPSPENLMKLTAEIQEIVTEGDKKLSLDDKDKLPLLFTRIRVLSETFTMQAAQEKHEDPKISFEEDSQSFATIDDRLAAAEAQLQKFTQATTPNLEELQAFIHHLSIILADMGKQPKPEDAARMAKLQASVQELIHKTNAKKTNSHSERLATAEVRFQVFQAADKINGRTLIEFGKELSAILTAMGPQPNPQELQRVQSMINKMEDLGRKIIM